MIKIKSNNIKNIKLFENTTLAYFRKKSNRILKINSEIPKPNPKIFEKADFDVNLELTQIEKERLYALIEDHLDVFSFDMVGKNTLN